jgi:hypothetical protein
VVLNAWFDRRVIAIQDVVHGYAWKASSERKVAGKAFFGIYPPIPNASTRSSIPLPFLERTPYEAFLAASSLMISFIPGVMRCLHLLFAEDVGLQFEVPRETVALECIQNGGPIVVLRIIKQALALDMHIPNSILREGFISIRKGFSPSGKPLRESPLIPTLCGNNLISFAVSAEVPAF